MRYICMIAVLLSGLMACKSTKNVAQQDMKLNSRQDSISYAVGLSIANNFKQSGANIDSKIVSKALMDVNDGKTTLLSDELSQQLLMEMQQQMQQEQMAKSQVESGANAKAGKEFLKKNGQVDGVLTTESGLQYQMLKGGSGKRPTASDVVRVHYEGKLIDGTVFDSSYKRGEPAEFGLGQVIRGWTEGLQLMEEGAKYRFYIPAELGYGDRGAGPTIPPGSTLIFDVELLEVK